MWYKKEGGAVIKALEIDKVQSLAIIQSPRALVYVPNPVRSLMLQAEAKNDPTAVPVTPMDHEESNAKQQAGMENYVFAIIQTDGKEHILRSGKLDRVIKWINTFAMASGMAYDTKMRQWNRSISMYYDQLAQERAQLQTFQNVSTTPLPQNSGRQRSTSIASTEITSSNTNNDHIDSESAAALIQSAKALTLSDPIPLPNSNSSDQTVDELEALAEKEEILRQEKETLRQELEAIETVETSRAEHNEVEEIKEMHIESDDRISVSTNPILKKSMNSTDNPLLAVKQSKPEDQAHFHETPDPVASVNESKPTPKKSVIKRRIKASRRASNGLDESDRMSETASVSSEYLEIDEDEMAAEIESSAIRMSQPSIPPPPPPSVPISASASAPVPSTLSLSPPPPPPPVSSPPPPQTTIQPSPSSKKERLSDSDINPLHAEALLTAARNDQPLRNEIKPVAIDSSKLSAKVVESSPEDRDSVMTVDLDDEDESSKSAKSSSSMKSNRSKKDRQTNRVSFAETVKDEHNKVPPGFHRSQVASLELEDNDRQHLIAKEKSGCGCCIIA